MYMYMYIEDLHVESFVRLGMGFPYAIVKKRYNQACCEQMFPFSNTSTCRNPTVRLVEKKTRGTGAGISNISAFKFHLVP